MRADRLARDRRRKAAQRRIEVSGGRDQWRRRIDGIGTIASRASSVVSQISPGTLRASAGALPAKGGCMRYTSAALSLGLLTLAACGGRVEGSSDDTAADRESVSVDSTPGSHGGADGGGSSGSASDSGGSGDGRASGGVCGDLRQHGLVRQFSLDEIGGDLNGKWAICSSTIDDLPAAVAGIEIDGDGYGALLVTDASGNLVRGEGPSFALNAPVNTTWLNRQVGGVTRYYAIDVFLTPFAMRIREQDENGKETRHEAQLAPVATNAWMKLMTSECGDETNWKCDFMPGQW